MKKLTDGWQVMAVPHMTLWVRWANKKRSKNLNIRIKEQKYDDNLHTWKKQKIICYEWFILSKMSFIYKSQEHTNKG
jgi:hypothetical protein